MGAKITFRDIARKAGVGTATVERVLNGRGGVRPQTAERVIAAVRKLDYPKRVPERHRGVLRIEVILVRPESEFFARLSKAFARIAATLDSSIAVHRTFVDENDPATIAASISSTNLRRSALILAAPDHALVRAAVTAQRAAGLPVVQIVSRMPGVDAHYVGIDNEAAGRMAGLLMAGLQNQAGSVVALCHSQVYAVHRERVRGFSDYLRRHRPDHLQFRQALFTLDAEREAKNRLHEALRDYPDLVGIYNAGGVNGALCDLLGRHPRRASICFIGHELTRHSSQGLKDGIMAAVMDQAPETQARRAIDVVLHGLELLEQPVDHTPIRFVTVTAENI